jgi:NADPH:quinone reductase-like Zn-dependent oxidoreductase
MIRFSEFGNPAEVLEVTEAPQPEPGPGEVCLRLTHRPVHPADFFVIMGLYAILPELPAAPGLEGMGRIEALGEGVTGFQPGQRVIPMGVTSGTWQEYIIANPAQLLPVPDAVSDQTAAQFVVNPVTAWAMLDELDLSAGDWML